MVVQDRVEGDVQDVGVDARSDKGNKDMTMEMRMKSFSKYTSIEASLIISLGPHTCTKRSLVRATKCGEVRTLYT